jgi:hypothetical protein
VVLYGTNVKALGHELLRPFTPDPDARGWLAAIPWCLERAVAGAG